MDLLMDFIYDFLFHFLFIDYLLIPLSFVFIDLLSFSREARVRVSGVEVETTDPDLNELLNSFGSVLNLDRYESKDGHTQVGRWVQPHFSTLSIRVWVKKLRRLPIMVRITEELVMQALGLVRISKNKNFCEIHFRNVSRV